MTETITSPEQGTRVPPVGENEAGPLVRVAYALSKRQMGGKVPDPLAATAHHLGLMMGYSAFEMATQYARKVPVGLKNLAVMRAAMLVGCEWCLDFGSAKVQQMGTPRRQLEELARWRDSDGFSAVEKLVLEYAEAMSRTPAEPTGDLLARLREHFDDGQIVELASVIAIENYRSRFNHGLGLQSQGYSEGAYCLRPEVAV